LISKHGLTIIIPDKKDRQLIHEVLYGNIQIGKIEQRSRDIFKKIIGKLADKGADGIILGCTEIPLYVKQEDYEIPLFDTTMIHARAAVEFALGSVRNI
jgi:aspartate racemase